MDSLAKRVANLSPEEQAKWMDTLSEEQLRELSRLPWWFIARPEQILPDGTFSIWLIMAGRGFGKTRAGAENLVDQILKNPLAPDGEPTEWAVFGETFSDVRKVCVEGPSGILRSLRGHGLVEGKDFTYNRSNWQINLTQGQKVHMVGADDPDAGRGLNLAGAWLDEVAKWRYAYETWSEGISFALRIGPNPKAIITTTPKRNKLLRDFLKRTDGSVYLTRGSTMDNRDNLSKEKLAELQALEGTRLYRQEVLGELLEDVPGALWTLDVIRRGEATEFKRKVIAIDPAVTNTEDSDETGIVMAGKTYDNTFAVLGDWSRRDSAFNWASLVNQLFEEHQVDAIVYEDNQGGEIIREVLHSVNPYLPVKKVRAKQGKKLRAEPVAVLYEQGKVFHVGEFDKLEDQMLTWNPDESTDSPDRVDALVHAIAELADLGAGSRFLSELADLCGACHMPNERGAKICRYCYKVMSGE
jgi:phage terminase large subunit-like protein